MRSASLKDAVGAEEWQLRTDLPTCYRLVAAAGTGQPGVAHRRASAIVATRGGAGRDAEGVALVKPRAVGYWSTTQRTSRLNVHPEE